MSLEEIKRAYKVCIKFRHKRIKRVPYKELDMILYVVDRYIKYMEEA